MPDEGSPPPGRKGRSFWSWAARAVVSLRFLILPAWIVGTVLATTHLPSVFDSESGELGSLLPRSSTALEVERNAIETFGLPLLSRTTPAALAVLLLLLWALLRSWAAPLYLVAVSIPIQSFREIAFALCVGLLLDTLIARTLLIPALVSLFGRGGAREAPVTSEAGAT